MVKTRSKSRSKKSKTTTNQPTENYDEGTNFVSGGIEENGPLFALAVCGPFVTILLGYVTSQAFVDNNPTMEPHLSTMLPICFNDLAACGNNVLSAGLSVFPPTTESISFIFGFMFVGFLLEFLPGKIETGPETATGHVPKYVDNALLHCLVSSVLFYLGSNLGPGKYYDFGIMYDVFPESIAVLNIFGISFCIFLMYKGLHYPSTADSGSSGSLVKDFLWGTELYPRLWGWWDLKRFVNCRFSGSSLVCLLHTNRIPFMTIKLIGV